METSILDTDQLLLLHGILDAEASSATEWLQAHSGDEARKLMEWQTSDAKVKKARRVRDEWLSRHPGPTIFRFWRRRGWEVARALAQQPVDLAKQERAQSDRKRAPEILEEIQRQRSEKYARREEIKKQQAEIMQRISVLQPTPAVEVHAPTSIDFDLPSADRIEMWRTGRDKVEKSAPKLSRFRR